MEKQLKFEICIDSVRSAKNAERAGAARVELCDNLIEGGTTPSMGMIRSVRHAIDIDLFVIIRPRGGDFLYDDDEFDVMCQDILIAKENKADGIVSGALTKDGKIHLEQTKKMVELAAPLPFTFHRAFDMCKDPFGAMKQLQALGVKRILTSGLQQTAEKGHELLSQLKEKGKDNIIIMPGAGINEANINFLVKKTGCSEFHFSGRKPFPSLMVYKNNNISMGGTPDVDEFAIKVSDYATIRNIIQNASMSSHE
jgi:copper homeostasis protein